MQVSGILPMEFLLKKKRILCAFLMGMKFDFRTSRRMAFLPGYFVRNERNIHVVLLRLEVGCLETTLLCELLGVILFNVLLIACNLLLKGE